MNTAPERNLDYAWAAHPIALPPRNRLALVLEDPEVRSCDRCSAAMGIREFLRNRDLTPNRGRVPQSVACGAGLHPSRNISREHPVSVHHRGSVWLTGFGIASRCPRSAQTHEAARCSRTERSLHGAGEDGG